MSLRAPEHADLISRVLAIQAKRTSTTIVSFLQQSELDALLAAPDRSTWHGRRDHALLVLAAQTGLRVGELTALNIHDLHLGTGAHVYCHGKGRKDRVATRVGAPVSTVRTWIRSVARSGEQLTSTALRVVWTLGTDTGPCWISGPSSVHPVRATLQALGTAANALTQTAATAPSSMPGALTGIDYLGLLAARHRQELHRWMRVSDPTETAATAPPWHQITMIIGGRLLTTTRSG